MLPAHYCRCTGKFSEIEGQLKTIRQNFTSLYQATKQSDLSKEYVEALLEYLRLWTNQKKEMDDWNSEISRIIQSLSGQQTSLAKKIAVWKMTDSVAIANSAPATLLQKIRGLESELTTNSNSLTNGIDRLLKYRIFCWKIMFKPNLCSPA